MTRFAPDRPARPLTMAARAALVKLYRVKTLMVLRPLAWRGWEIRDRAGLMFWYPIAAGDELQERGLVDDAGQITQEGIDEVEKGRQ